MATRRQGSRLPGRIRPDVQLEPGRLDIMNGSAPAFFHMLQGELSDMILPHLSRMTDKQVTAG
jgi:hypothetical protein